MTLRTEYAELAIERERVARKLARPTLAERIARAWFSPRIEPVQPAADPLMFAWFSVEEMVERERGR